MELDGTVHLTLYFAACAACGDAARQIRRISRVPGGGLLDNNQIAAHFSPACLRILFLVESGYCPRWRFPWPTQTWFPESGDLTPRRLQRFDPTAIVDLTAIVWRRCPTPDSSLAESGRAGP